MIFYDTETCGFYGLAVLIQWAEDDGPINLHDVWASPAEETMRLIEYFMSKVVCGFNLAFDHFHLTKLYTTFSLLTDKSQCPEDCIEEIAILEERARDVDLCLKPEGALDLFLHARKSEYQATMERSDIRIKRVPIALAWKLAKELDSRIELKDLYFARKKDPTKRWEVYDIKDDVGNVDPEFKDIVLKFSPKMGLKELAADALGIEAVKFEDLVIEPKPEELGYAPYALAIGSPGDWKGAWPEVIDIHIREWRRNERARLYASNDVHYTRELYKFFGSPAHSDYDSVLACMVASVRWRGFRVDIDKLQILRSRALTIQQMLPFKYRSSAVVKRYLSQVMTPTEQVVIAKSTKGIILEEIAKWRKSEVCDKCSGEGCDICNNEGLIKSEEWHPAAERAQEILNARRAAKEIELYDKIILAGRFHASLKVIGTLSSRMAGADKMNPQGIKNAKYVRKCFPLHWPGFVLSGGDFKSFEISLMDAAYADPTLREELLSKQPCHKCNGDNPKCKECDGAGETDTKIHALLGVFLFPPLTYRQILETKGLGGEKDKYDRSKKGVFAMAYGGEAYTLKTRVGVDEKTAEEAFQRWIAKYKVWGRERVKLYHDFCPLRQDGGIGTKVEWHDPKDYIESMFGFKRYFTLENTVIKVLYELSNDPPKEWLKIPIKVVRRDRVQTVGGAVRSSLLGCAFGMASANVRAAGNHKIQSSGATTTKELQAIIWKFQPNGVSRWHVQPLNIHDEIMCPMLPELTKPVAEAVHNFVDSLKPVVPLIGIDWQEKMQTWADK